MRISIIILFFCCFGKADAHLTTSVESWSIAIRQHFPDQKDTVKKPREFKQYYLLQKALEKYQAISQNGGWQTITCDKHTMLKYGSTSQIVAATRKRLFAEGYLTADSGSPIFDAELLSALNQFKVRHNQPIDSAISDKVIAAMNVPIEQRIQTIEINLERCRLVTPDTTGNYIAVNIPAFKLYYFSEGKLVLDSKVVVGKEATKTVIFNGIMNQIVFSPYWNIPNSIAQKEVLPAIKKNPRLLSQMKLEWHDGKLRQKPGPFNALGLVKFIFPNSNNIYLHDTPSKAYFNEEKRAFSHGCIRVEKAYELAAAIMQHDYGWTTQQTWEAMNAGNEKTYALATKIPVYIGYFTAWADEAGLVSFYHDIYRHDQKTESER